MEPLNSLLCAGPRTRASRAALCPSAASIHPDVSLQLDDRSADLRDHFIPYANNNHGGGFLKVNMPFEGSLMFRQIAGASSNETMCHAAEKHGHAAAMDTVRGSPGPRPDV